MLSGAATLIALSLVIPPWQTASEWVGGGYEDHYKGWRPLLMRPDTSVPILDYEVRRGRMPGSALSDPDTVEKFSGGFFAVPADVAWDVLITEWMIIAVCAAGLWLALPGSVKPSS